MKPIFWFLQSTFLISLDLLLASTVSGDQDAKVKYQTLTTCALERSSVNIVCSYINPKDHKVTSIHWFKGQSPHRATHDILQDDMFKGRIEYLGDRTQNCSLRINNLNLGDSGIYWFAFETDRSGKQWSSSSGFTLSVTDLSVEVVPEENVTAGEVVDLYCGSCILSEAPAYVWLKDSDVVSSLEGTNQLLLDPAHEDDTGSYSCQVKGHEAAPHPVKLTVACKQQVQVKLSPEQGIEGEQLELTCVTSCPVNGRLATFTWYKDSSLLLGQNQHQHFVLDPVRVENMGKYSCGLSGHEEIHSKPVQLLVQYSPKNTTGIALGEPLEGTTLTLNCSSDANPPVENYTWFKVNESTPVGSGQQYSITNIRSEDGGQYYCEARNTIGSEKSPSILVAPQAWLNILEMECKDTDALCKLNTLLDMEKNLTESSRIPPLVLFSALDVFLKSPPVAQEDNVLELTERLIQKVQTSSLTNSTQRFRINDTVVDMASIGPNTSQTASLHLRTIDVLEIDLWAIAQNNNGSASVVALSSGSMHKVFNSSHFHARDAEQTYIGAKLELIVLPQVKDKTLSTPVNITFRHFKDSDPADEPACVFWSKGTWITDGCVVSQSNSTLTVCTCSHLSTFALIMQTNPTTESNPFVEKLAAFFVVVGLIFLILAVLTFAFCRRNTRVTNVARLNLSVSLLLAHALFFITQTAIKVNKPPMALCKLLAGVLHFLFLSSFVWMSAEALLLFLSVRKLRQIKAKDHMGPHWRYKLLIGYGIPLVIVSVSAMAVPDGHGSKECWLKTDKGFNWSFLGPACIILTANIILFVITFITIHTTLRAAKSEVSKVKYTRLLLFKLMAQCVILGCPWIFLMASEKSGVLEIIFVILTSQQGTTIFLIHCVLNDEARKQYATLWRKYDPRHKPSSSVVFTSNKHCSDTQHTPVPLSQYTLDGTNESD